VKVLARFPENPPGANLGSLLLLVDADNGFPLAIMDGAYVTAVRTGAGAGLATEALARPGASRVAVIGSGVVAWYSLLAMTRTRRKIADVSVYSRAGTRREHFAQRVRAELGLGANAVASIDAAVSDADIIVTATNSPEPVLFPEHLRPGVLVNGHGHSHRDCAGHGRPLRGGRRRTKRDPERRQVFRGA
jgi:ornithine cyclodeaminase/alanine dehydrogenase-like protein (mu-crystallin family)